jgi:hypothetical protein
VLIFLSGQNHAMNLNYQDTLLCQFSPLIKSNSNKASFVADAISSNRSFAFLIASAFVR